MNLILHGMVLRVKCVFPTQFQSEGSCGKLNETLIIEF